MARQSGFESLIDALKRSGLDVDKFSDPAGGEEEEVVSDDVASDEGDDSGDSGSDAEPGRSFFGFPGGRSRSGRGKRGSGGGGGKGGEPPHVEFESKLSDRIAQWSKRTLIIACILAIVILLGAYWWFHPPISINSVDTWFFVGIFILLPLFLFARVKSFSWSRDTNKHVASPSKSKAYHTLSFVPIIIVVVGLIGALLSLSLFPGNAAKYAHVLETEQLDFAQDIKQVDYSQIPVIDHDSAALLGNREMGTIADYVSQFEVDDLYSQINYKGAPVRVSPLGYADLFKWFTNRGEGIPAYALVNMTTQDAEIVRLGEGNGMKYTASEPLARNIDRYVQLKYPFYIFDQKAFEIDEDGHPWWICPVRAYTIGLFGGETISRVVLCDAVSGECQDLPVAEVPSWVDRAYPSDLLVRQYNWSGLYINGWFNSWLGQSGVFQTTPGTDGMLGYNYIAKDDDVWVYTGVTSATSDSSIIGFVLINQRTAESHFYSVAGATEDSAMRSAEGQVQHLRYTATFPLLINVDNQPTYFMALKDAAGLVKQFAMIDIQRYQNVAVGNTVAECQTSYETLLITNGALTIEDANANAVTSDAAGAIRTMTQAVLDGNTHFYVTLDGDARIYDFPLPDLIPIVTYQVGDTISVTYIDGEPTCLVRAINTASTAAAAPAILKVTE